MSDKTLRAFHGDPQIKAKYVARVRAHQLADEITQGYYWENGKGCAVGCTIHSNAHNRYEVELGIPEWLARLEDAIFEGLPNEQAKLFPLRFLEAIPVGADLEGVYYQYCHWLLVDPEHGVLRLVPREAEPGVHNAIVRVANLPVSLETLQATLRDAKRKGQGVGLMYTRCMRGEWAKPPGEFSVYLEGEFSDYIER